jgi:hypothetical protein
VVEFPRSGQEKTKEGRVRRRKTGTSKMTFTGNLIESLMATVERAEQKAYSDEPLFAESVLSEPWLASMQQNTDYDSKLLGVA